MKDNTNKYDTLDGVVIDKPTLLNVLKDNREKHNAVYEVACSGFWFSAQNKLEEKRVQFAAALSATQEDFNYAFSKSLKQHEDKDKNINLVYSPSLKFTSNLSLSYPENHLDDYDTVIRKLELSVAGQIKLSNQEFDSYVMNKWAWRGSFLGTNSAYVNYMTTGYMPIYGSGCAFTNSYSNLISISGCASF